MQRYVCVFRPELSPNPISYFRPPRYNFSGVFPFFPFSSLSLSIVPASSLPPCSPQPLGPQPILTWNSCIRLLCIVLRLNRSRVIVSVCVCVCSPLAKLSIVANQVRQNRCCYCTEIWSKFTGSAADPVWTPHSRACLCDSFLWLFTLALALLFHHWCASPDFW